MALMRIFFFASLYSGGTFDGSLLCAKSAGDCRGVFSRAGAFLRPIVVFYVSIGARLDGWQCRSFGAAGSRI